MTDDETGRPWWTAFLAGDLNAFAQLVEHYQDDVFAVALATVIDRSLAEDVAQETFIAAFVHRARLRDPKALGGWLAAIARNLGRDLLRARRSERLVDLADLESTHAADESATWRLDHASLCDHVRRALARVPQRYREVLILYYSYERSVESIAQALGLTEATTMQRLSRGRKLVARHGLSLREFVGRERPNRSFAVAVLALLAMRRAEAAASPHSTDGRTTHPPSSAVFRRASSAARWPSRRATAARRPSSVARRSIAVIGVGVALLIGWIGADQAANAGFVDDSAIVVASHDASSAPSARPLPAARSVVEDAIKPATPRKPRANGSRPRQTRDRREPSGLPQADAPVAALDASELPLALATPDFQCSPCLSVEQPRPALSSPAIERWDLFNGMLETAALPRPGEISFETVGSSVIARAGLTRHLAAHVGFASLDIRKDTVGANVALALGGGLKLGTRISRYVSFAVLGEGAREVRKAGKLGEAWIGRAYGSLTFGTARTNATLSLGMIAEDDKATRWTSGMIGVGGQLGWDDNLAFVVEAQQFTTPRGPTEGTTVLAVRFRNHNMPRHRVRLDLGAVLVDETDDNIKAIPWIQLGFGW